MKAARPVVALCLSIMMGALTNLRIGLAILGLVVTTVACAAGPVHVAPAASTSFAEMMMAEETANARRPAHFMRQTVRGGSSGKARAFDNNKLPEAYTQKSKLTVWPSQFHLAYAARTLLRAHYAATHSAHQAIEDGELVDVVDKAGGNLYTLHEFEKDCQLDIADVQGRRLFELVPPGQVQREAGKNWGWDRPLFPHVWGWRTDGRIQGVEVDAYPVEYFLNQWHESRGHEPCGGPIQYKLTHLSHVFYEGIVSHEIRLDNSITNAITNVLKRVVHVVERLQTPLGRLASRFLGLKHAYKTV